MLSVSSMALAAMLGSACGTNIIKYKMTATQHLQYGKLSPGMYSTRRADRT